MRSIAVAEPKASKPNVKKVEVNDAPILDLNGASAGTSTTASYSAGSSFIKIAPAGTVTDPDSPDFHGGTLRVGITGNGTATDQLAVMTDAIVTLTGNENSALRQIKINGTLIGTLSGGKNGTDLVVALHSTATAEHLQILIEHIGYANSSSAPSTLARAVTFTLTDGDGTADGGQDTGVATATISYGSSNVAPTLAGDRAATVAEGGSTVITSADLSFIDPDDNATGVTFTASDVMHGTLKVGGVEALSFTGQQLADGLVTFEHDGSEIGASFNVIVEDGNEDGSMPVASAFQFTVNPVNDAPFIACDLFADIAEGGSYTITQDDLWFNDPDDGPSDVTFTVSNATNGHIKVNGVAATSFTGQQLLDGLVVFEHDGSETTGASFDVSVEDGDEDGSVPIAIGFTVAVSGVNDAPMLTGSLSADVMKSGSHTIVAAELGFSDPDDLAAGVTFTVADMVNGTVTVGGVPATSFTVEQLLNGLVKFTHDGSNTVAASFAVSVEDGNEDGSVPVPSIFTLAVKPADIDITTLTASQGFIIQGDADGDLAGWSVSNAGDVNGDGFDDVIVGAPAGDNHGTDSGEAYIVFGKASGFGTIDLSNLTTETGLIIQGDIGLDNAGRSVSAAGDVNGDGIGDIIIGAPFGDDGGSNAGEAYVVFGKAGGFGNVILDLRAIPASNGFIIRGDINNDWAGSSVSSAGDVNGDGYDDLLVGAQQGDDGGVNAGEAYVVYGKASGFSTVDLTNFTAANGFIIQGDVALDGAGWSVSSAGDINGDGLDDLIVGAPFGDDGGIDAGEAYVVFGKTTGFGVTVGVRQVVDLTGLAATDGFVIQGDGAGDQAGMNVSSAGDVNGDGFDDLIVGAIGGDDGGTDSGEAYVVFGKASGLGRIDLTDLTAAQGFIIQGDAPGDQMGLSVSAAGDVNGDGFDDLIVGAPFGDNGGMDAGEAYIVFGKDSGFGTTVGTRQVVDLATLAFPNGFLIQGDTDGDQLGWSVSAAGDVNNDGYDDLIVGAPFGDDGGANAGEAYVIFGSAFWGP